MQPAAIRVRWNNSHSPERHFGNTQFKSTEKS